MGLDHRQRRPEALAVADLDVGADVLGERWSVARVDGVQIVANLYELMPDLQKKKLSVAMERERSQGGGAGVNGRQSW